MLRDILYSAKPSPPTQLVHRRFRESDCMHITSLLYPGEKGRAGVSPDYKSEIFARLVLGPGSSPAAIFRGNKSNFHILQNENILMIKMINYLLSEP